MRQERQAADTHPDIGTIVSHQPARRVRIAVSLLFGLLTLLLCLLWVRSYWWVDIVEVNAEGSEEDRQFISACGVLVIDNCAPLNRRWAGGSVYHEIRPAHRRFVEQFHKMPQFKLDVEADGWGLNLPYWFLAAVAAMCSAVPWVQSNFSLRTLLLATTLVAIVLGFSVWATR